MTWFNIKTNNPELSHKQIGDYVVEKLREKGFNLFYNDQYDYYSTIDFRKDGDKYNVMLVHEVDFIKCSVDVYRSFVNLILKHRNKSKISSFENLVRSIITESDKMKIVN